MSGSLDFYSVSWEAIRRAIGSRDAALIKDVSARARDAFGELYKPADFGGGAGLEGGVRRWIEGLSVLPASGTRGIAQLGEGLGFISLVLHLGRSAGTLPYASASAATLVDDLLERRAARALGAPFPLRHLTSRPILGLESGLDVTWGGLSAAELTSLKAKLAQDPPPQEDDADADEWIQDLWSGLGSALDLGDDLVTIFV